MRIQLLIVAMLLGCLPSGSTPSEGSVVPPISATFAEATPDTASAHLRATGTVVGEMESLVAAGTSGRVSDVFAERGQSVSKGDRLMKVDDRLLQATAEEARAAVALAEANEEVAKGDCERAQALFDKGLSNAASLEKSLATCKTAEANADAARARLRASEVRLADTALKAPFDGIISERRVSPGEFVRDDVPAFRLVATSPLRLKLSLGEADAARIHGGETVEFEVSGETTLRKATVDRVAPSLNEKGRSLSFEALVLDTDGLKPGAFVSARVIVGEQPAVSVPTAALRSDAGIHHLFVAKGGKLEERLVEVGEVRGDRTLVLEGLAAGEKVVSPLTPQVRDGAAVTE